jgi:beta-xylosidase
MKVRGALCIAILLVGVVAILLLGMAVWPPSLQAGSIAPASSYAPALIVDPTIPRPDPAIIWDPESKVYRMYTSETFNGFVPEWRSGSPTGPWTFVRDALPVQPTWAANSFSTWAPEVADVNGVWTMWGSAAISSVSPTYCLYRATAKTAAGPFVPDSRRLPCDIALSGDIDPTMVHDSDQWWLVYKTNANGVGLPDSFISIRIGPDGWVSGPSHVAMTATAPWEAGMIEAPSLVENRGQWWVIFSVGDPFIAEPTYHIAAAPCDGPAGPCHISAVVSLVTTNLQGNGPGEQAVFTDAAGQPWIAYNPSGFSRPRDRRPLALVRLGFDHEGDPYVITP